MDSYTCSLLHLASFLEHDYGICITEEGPRRQHWRASRVYASVWFNGQCNLKGVGISFLRERQDSTGVFLQDWAGFLPKCQGKCWHDCEKKMRCLCQHPLDFDREPHLWARVIASFWTKDCVTAIDSHHEGDLWSQKGQKSVVFFGENVGRQGRKHRDLISWQNSSWKICLESKYFCSLFALSELERRFSNHFLSYVDLKGLPPKSCWNVYSLSAFREMETNVSSFGWNLVHAFQRGKLLKSHLFCLSQHKRKLFACSYTSSFGVQVM